jgi:hypothetical protein
METKFLIVGALLIVVGGIRHFVPKAMLPRIGYKIMLPGWMIAGLGVILVIAGLILGQA